MASRICALVLILSGLCVQAGQFPTDLFELQETSQNVGGVQTSTFTVKLNKEVVPVVVDGREVFTRTALWGTVFLGKPVPQTFSVVFDTGSGHLFVPSSFCETNTCKIHNQYNHSISMSGSPIDRFGRRASNLTRRDRVSIGYGTGDILGDFSEEIVCISAPDKLEESLRAESPHCTKARVITATLMSDEPFGQFKFDGVFGLGLPPLVVQPEFHIVSQLAKSPTGIDPMFGCFMSRVDEVPSEITFGGRNEARSAGEPHWVPVLDPADGHWKIGIKSIRIDGKALDYCDDGRCSAIVDTGTSLIAAPLAISSELMQALLVPMPEGTPLSSLCGDLPGPVLEFEVNDGYILTLEPAEYMRRNPWDKDYGLNLGADGTETHASVNATENITLSAPGSEDSASNSSDDSSSTPAALMCYPSIMGLEMDALGVKVFLLGYPVLEKYYTVYDQGNLRIGFAPAVQGVFEPSAI